jgi:hypothetical protein
MLIEHLRRVLVAMTCLSLLGAATPMPAHAGIISTDQAVALEFREAYIDEVRAALARDDLRSGLLSMGVDPAEVNVRLAGLTDAELATLAERIEQAPAGGNFLAIIGIVFLVLLLLEYTGTIDIFKKVP